MNKIKYICDRTDEIEAMFKIKRKELSFEGFLTPNDNTVFAYNRPAVHVCGEVSLHYPWGVRFFAHILTIDDSSLDFEYPISNREQATKEMNEFIEWIETLAYQCPTRDEVKEFCNTHGCSPYYN